MSRRCKSAALSVLLALAACGDPAARGASHAVNLAGRTTESPSARPEVFEVEITGQDFEWHMRYPGQDGCLGTADDLFGWRDLYLPVGAQVRLHLRSRDYIYNLALPHLGLKEVAVPELEFSLAFEAQPQGVFELRGDQMCGWTHPKLLGTLHIVSAEAAARAIARTAVQ